MERQEGGTGKERKAKESERMKRKKLIVIILYHHVKFVIPTLTLQAGMPLPVSLYPEYNNYKGFSFHISLCTCV